MISRDEMTTIADKANLELATEAIKTAALAGEYATRLAMSADERIRDKVILELRAAGYTVKRTDAPGAVYAVSWARRAADT